MASGAVGTGNALDNTYTVSYANNAIIEAADGGTDTVTSSVSYMNYTLGANIENLILYGYGVMWTGNDLNNVLTSNGSGPDTLNGGAGADTMSGGLGDDTYYVDNAGDVVIENANAGTDTIKSSISYTLSANVENMELLGGGLVATGNALDNAYTINHSGNSVVEAAGGGIDTVVSSQSYTLDANVENPKLTASGAVGTGNTLNNILTGNGSACKCSANSRR